MRSKTVKWIGVFLLCFVLQTTLVPLIGIAGIVPDLLIVVLFLYALRYGQMPAICAGFVLGFTQDLFSSPSILGQNALSKTVAGFFAGFFNERMMRLDIIVQMVLLLVTFLVNDLVYFVVQAVKTEGGGTIIHHMAATSIPRALYSMAFALIPYVKERFLPTISRR